MLRDWRQAAIDGDGAGLARLLEAGAAINGRDGKGQTALMLAARRGHQDAVDLLLQRGADPDVAAKYGLTALMLAIVNGHAAVARSLVDAGADLSPRGSGAPGFAGKTARDLAEARGFAELGAYIARAEAAG